MTFLAFLKDIPQILEVIKIPNELAIEAERLRISRIFACNELEDGTKLLVAKTDGHLPACLMARGDQCFLRRKKCPISANNPTPNEQGFLNRPELLTKKHRYKNQTRKESL